MGNRHYEELRHFIREKRIEIARIESLCDYVDELEQKVEHWKSRYEILVEAKTEASNEEEANGANTIHE